jgi:cytochrome c2
MRSLALSAALVLFSPALASRRTPRRAKRFCPVPACHQVGESAKNAVGPC